MLFDDRRFDGWTTTGVATKTVESLIHVQKLIQDSSCLDIGFFEYKKGYFPCIHTPGDNAEAKYLLTKKLKTVNTSNYICTRYLGSAWKDAMRYDAIAASKFVPLSLPPSADDERRLQKFLQSIKREKKFKDNPVDLKVEEILIRKCWAQFLDLQARRAVEDQQESERRKASASLRLPAAVVSQDDCSTAATTTTTHSPAKTTPAGEGDDDDDEDNGEEVDGSSPGKDGNNDVTLKVGDRIAFYAPEGTAGLDEWLRTSTILGIRPEHEYPLVLTELSSLPASHHVRKLPDGLLRPIESYILGVGRRGTASGEQNAAAALGSTVSHLKRARGDIQQASDEYWQRGGRRRQTTSSRDDVKGDDDNAKMMDPSGKTLSSLPQVTPSGRRPDQNQGERKSRRLALKRIARAST